jgi:hypothetical protein
MTGATFFERLAKLRAEDPPYPGDSRMIEALKKLGVEPGRGFDPTKLDPAILKGIDQAPSEVWKDFWAGPYGMKTVNGRINGLDLGAWGKDYTNRAFIAFGGLGALPKEDALYPSAFVDGSGTALDGSHGYVIHFPKGEVAPSKVDVWSISPYRDNFYVKNSLDRYGILSSMPRSTTLTDLSTCTCRKILRVRIRSRTGCRFRRPGPTTLQSVYTSPSSRSLTGHTNCHQSRKCSKC